MSAVSHIVADLLNEAFESDPVAMYHLQASMIPCNKALADHPEIIVRQTPVAGEQYNVTALGLINGILARLGEPPVSTQWEESTEELAKNDFRNSHTLIGFRVEEPKSVIAEQVL